MRELLDRFGGLRSIRAIGIAVVVLVLTVGVALAAAPSAHPGNSGSHGQGHGQGHGPQASAGADESESPENETDEDGAADGAHGALVSAAAQMETPAGFRNHGAFVSCVAHLKDVTLETIDWSSVTPESCAAAAPGNSSH